MTPAPVAPITKVPSTDFPGRLSAHGYVNRRDARRGARQELGAKAREKLVYLITYTEDEQWGWVNASSDELVALRQNMKNQKDQRSTDDAALLAYVTACNGLRSAEQAAIGFVSGKRIEAVKVARATKTQRLADLAVWVERQARLALNPPGTDPGKAICSRDIPS